MAAFILKRLLWTVPVLLVVVTITFFMLRAIGGSPFRHGPLLGFGHPAWVKYGDQQPESIEYNMAHRYGLDLPWYRQYANYLRGLVTFDLGPSLSYRNRTVNEIVREQARPSLEVGALAFLLALGIGIPVGLLAALRAGTTFDYAARLLSGVGVDVPSFLLATLLIYLVSLKLGWLPTSGWSTSWRYQLLPAVALSLLPMAHCVRLVRGSVLETLSQDYVRTAIGKGLRRRSVVTRHVLRNSLIPLVTAAGPLLGFLLTGSFVIESIFAIPGIGRHYVAAAAARDFPLVLGLTVLLATLIVLVNLVVDILYGVLDPRIRDAR